MQFGLCMARSASRNYEKDGGWSGMPGHVWQNDTDFTLLRPKFAIGPPFMTNFGGPQPLSILPLVGVEWKGR